MDKNKTQPSPAGHDSLADEIDLIRAVLDGYPDSMARSDALRATRVIRAALAARQPADPERGHIDPSWSLHDRVEFALRDAGFDLDEAAFVAEAADRGRQPAGEPVAWIRSTLVETSTGEVGYLIKCGAQQEHDEDVPLYRHPPAQAVDLEQFREAVLDSYSLAQEYETGSRESAEETQAAAAERDRLLALIDSQAVGK